MPARSPPDSAADLIVFPRDPFTLTPAELINLVVDLTIVGGHVIFERGRPAVAQSPDTDLLTAKFRSGRRSSGRLAFGFGPHERGLSHPHRFNIARNAGIQHHSSAIKPCVKSATIAWVTLNRPDRRSTPTTWRCATICSLRSTPSMTIPTCVRWCWRARVPRSPPAATSASSDRRPRPPPLDGFASAATFGAACVRCRSRRSPPCTALRSAAASKWRCCATSRSPPRTPRFCLPETSLGMIPGVAGTQTASRRLGLGWALDLNITGRWIDAQQALFIGLVAEVVPRQR